METVFLTQIKFLLTKRNFIQQIIEIIKNNCNFTCLYNEHVGYAFHLKESLIRNFVYMRISYFIKFYNRYMAPQNKTKNKGSLSMLNFILKVFFKKAYFLKKRVILATKHYGISWSCKISHNALWLKLHVFIGSWQALI